jgi:hypothetical protein
MESALRESLNRLTRVARRESAHAIGPEDESKQIIAKIQVSVVAENLFVRFLRSNENKLCTRIQTSN